MRIFFQDIHGTLTESIAKVIDSFGGVMLLGDASVAPLVGCGASHTGESVTAYGPNVRPVSFEELCDAPPEIVLLSCFHAEAGIIRNIWPRLLHKSRLVMYDGNNYSPGRRYDLVKYVVTSDCFTWKRNSREKQTLLFYPPCDYRKFPWQGCSDSRRLGCYINSYAKVFPRDFAFSKGVQTSLDRKNVEVAFHDFVPREQVPSVMKESSGTMHIKPLEGYGFSIIESLASGRPVFLYEPYSLLKSYRNWCVAENTAVYFNSRDELLGKLGRFFSDDDYRHRMQENAARTVRSVIDFKEQSENLEKYFRNVLDDGPPAAAVAVSTPARTGFSGTYPATVWNRVEAALDESDLKVLGKIGKPVKRLCRSQVVLYACAAFIRSFLFKGRLFRGGRGFADSMAAAVFVYYFLRLGVSGNREIDVGEKTPAR
ncbi:MAG: glycosyltransferase [Chitinispirillaceae bacterium]|nr:glycosyltransferase [Chitinispirillaceae bacterium]